MYSILVRLMLIAALAQFGLRLADLGNCHSRQCAQMFEKRARDVLRVEWKPISVFPEEARRFK